MAYSGLDSTTTAAILTAMHPSTGTSSFTCTYPIKLLFLSAVRSTDSGTDTEWSTSGGYTAGTGFSGLTFAASSNGTGTGGASTQASNVAATITNAPGTVTWAGCKEVDSSGTPHTLFIAGLTTSKTVNAGDTVTVPSGQLTDQLS